MKTYVVRYTGMGVQVERYTNGGGTEIIRNFSGMGYEANLAAADKYARSIANGAPVRVLP